MIEKILFKNPYVLWGFYFFVVFLVGTDIFEDIIDQEPFLHILAEAGTMIGLSTLTFVALLYVVKVKENQEEILYDTLKELDQSRQDIKVWKKKTSALTLGLSQVIDEQFKEWGLSRSEKEVGLLLIKGISTKQIASIRETAEKTVRVQLSSIYRKSDVAGRAEFCSFFLEDLLLPNN